VSTQTKLVSEACKPSGAIYPLLLGLIEDASSGEALLAMTGRTWMGVPGMGGSTCHDGLRLSLLERSVIVSAAKQSVFPSCRIKMNASSVVGPKLSDDLLAMTGKISSIVSRGTMVLF
jgi:hypothetical protein